MENEYTEQSERERLRDLEKKLHRAFKFFGASILTSIVASFNLVHTPEPSTYDAIAFLGVIPLTFGSWLNSMYYKTEEYCKLAQKYYCNNNS